jgi:4-aminobutyrate aminotransferase/(S)-3-amino-2-methylpropionate transaminase
MVFIYHRLFRPHITDFESIPKLFRDFFFKLNKKFSPFNKNIFKLSEPKYPIIKSSYPGPKMKNLLNDLEICNPNYLSIKSFINYEKSTGNYFKDCDGNMFLDFSNSGNNNILGYNSTKIFESYLKNENLFHKNFVNKSHGFNNYLNTDIVYTLEKFMSEVKPPAMEKVLFNESPEQLAFLLSMVRRGKIQSENLKSLNINYENNADNNNQNEFSRLMLPQTNFSQKIFFEKFKILKITPNSNTSLNSNYSLNFSDNSLYKYSPFPSLKYPLKENMKENYSLESKCLEEAEKILKEKFDVSAILIEAVAEGEKWATPKFFSKLRKLACLYNADFIVDERKSGLAVGRTWQHELWNLHLPPDFVLFGNKLLNSGLFVREEALPDKVYNFYCDFNNVDFNNLAVLGSVMGICNEKDLFAKSEKAGEYFKLGLKDVNKKIGLFKDIRGKGSLIAFDVLDARENEEHELQSVVFDRFISYCKNSGIFVDGNKDTNTVFIRPNIIVENRHYDVLLNTIEEFKR